MVRDRSAGAKVLALAAGVVLVLVGPALLLRQALKPEPWDAAHLHVSFESVRYERAGLVFTYRVENRTRRAERFLPDATSIRVMQPPDRPAAGFPVIVLPLDIESHATRRVELRLELPLPRGEEDDRRKSDDQTERVLQHQLPGPHDLESPLAALPMSRPPALPAADPPARDVETLYRDALNTVEGFELNNRPSGIRIVFPRGW